MKTWIWLFLGLLTVTLGCAQGYYDRPARRDTGATMNWQQNPETQEEYKMRIWREDSEPE